MSTHSSKTWEVGKNQPGRRSERRIAQAWVWADAKASSGTDLQGYCTIQRAQGASYEGYRGTVKRPWLLRLWIHEEGKERKKRNPIYIISASSSVLFLVLKEKNRKAEEDLHKMGFMVISRGRLWSRIGNNPNWICNGSSGRVCQIPRNFGQIFNYYIC